MHGLYAWLRRHPVLVDGVLALLVLAGGSAFFPATWVRDPALLPVMILLAVPVMFRRARPALAFAAVIVAGLLLSLPYVRLSLYGCAAGLVSAGAAVLPARRAAGTSVIDPLTS